MLPRLYQREWEDGLRQGESEREHGLTFGRRLGRIFGRGGECGLSLGEEGVWRRMIGRGRGGLVGFDVLDGREISSSTGGSRRHRIYP